MIIMASGCGNNLQKVRITRPVMGTFVSITAYSNNPAEAQKHIEEAFAEIDRIESMMSFYRDDSELSKINGAGTGPTELSSEMFSIIEQSIGYSEISGGAFDITSAPLIRLWKKAIRESALPGNAGIEEAMKMVGYKKLNLDINTDTLRFEYPGMKIDLGAIAKGYAADRAIELLRNKGIEHALVDAGGDIRSLGTKPGAEPWAVALQNPRDPDDYLVRLNIQDNAVTTSGDYEQFFIENGSRYSHIVDPRTGKTVSGCISATVVAPTAMQADALSTTIMVTGAKEGLSIIEKIPGVEALIVDSDKKLHRSSNFSLYETPQL